MRLPVVPSRWLFSAALALALGSACASHDSATGKPEAAPRIQLRASIAAVQLIQDCPDRDPAPAQETAKPAAMEPPKDEAASASQPISAGGTLHGAAARAVPGDSLDGGGFQQPCTQSTMQLSLAHDDDAAQRIEVVEVRLLKAGGTEALGKLAARKPSRWNDTGVYDAWDERVPVGGEIKVSYRLGEPDWSKVQETLGAGNDPYSQRWILEVDLKMDGQITTIRSPEFTREHPHVIVT